MGDGVFGSASPFASFGLSNEPNQKSMGDGVFGFASPFASFGLSNEPRLLITDNPLPKTDKQQPFAPLQVMSTTHSERPKGGTVPGP